jgi:hypothetical protein
MKIQLEKIFLILATLLTYYVYIYIFSNNIVKNTLDNFTLSYFLAFISLIGFISIYFSIFIVTFLLGILWGNKVSLGTYFNEFYKTLYFELLFHVFAISILLLNLDELKSIKTTNELSHFSQLDLIDLSYYVFNSAFAIYLISILKDVFALQFIKALLIVIVPLVLYFSYKLLF